MDTIKFKRALHLWEWDEDAQKGYRPYYGGVELPYFIQYDDFLKDWSVWRTDDNAGAHVCGGLTYGEAKESFTNYYLTKLRNFYGE